MQKFEEYKDFSNSIPIDDDGTMLKDAVSALFEYLKNSSEDD